MSTDSQFVRAIPQRSSRGHYKRPPESTAPSSTLSTSQDLSVQEVRQRALQAAEYYHRTVRGVGDDDDDDDDGRSHPSSMSSRVNGSQSGEALRAGVTPTSHDAYYKQKLRDGFIELRNTYSVKGKPLPNPKPYTASSSTSHHNKPRAPPPPLGQVREGVQLSQPRPKELTRLGAHHRHPTLADRRGLYKSNSSLELDHLDYGEPPSTQFLAARREFGSTSSLDIMSASGDSFFALLQEYRTQNADQRAPAPPKMQEVLRGRPPNRPANVAFATESRQQPADVMNPVVSSPQSNGAIIDIIPPADETDSTDVTGSPKLKSKSLKGKDRKARNKSTISDGSSGGLFKKLRGSKSTDAEAGSKSPESSSEGDFRSEDRQKRKAVVHFDCQSVGVSLLDVIRRRQSSTSEDGGSLGKRKNITTGASAASGVRNSADFGNTNLDDTDLGDGKSNDLVLSCPFFRNEVGGEEERTVALNRVSAQKRVQQLLGTKGLDTQMVHRKPVCNGAAILDTSQSPHGIPEPSLVTHNGYVIEYVDHGAVFYRNFFHDFDHQNFFGVDDYLGPVAVSIRREKLDEKERDTPSGKSEGAGHCYHYRFIVRTSELTTLRGCILEEAVPSSSRLSSTRGLPPKEVLENVVPELNMACLKQAMLGIKTADQLVKLDEQGLTKTYKIGVMYCKAGQSTEEEMYNNEHASPAFEEFIEMIGHRVALKGFEKYRGGLDCRTDSTGTESVFAEFGGYEIMFHISTLLPFTPNNKQQLLRKRHIGNDIVTIIFQEPGALPFTPKSVRSHFQHIFIIVRVHNPNTDNVKYSMAVTRSKDVPPFGPAILDGMMFPKTAEFSDFLLTKAINAENAVHRSEKFIAMATRTRQEYLKDLATNFVTGSSMDSSSKLSKFSLGSGRRKEKAKVRTIPDMYTKGALVWCVQLEDFGQANPVDCYLAIGSEVMVLIEEKTKDVAFATPCMSVIGWTPHGNSLRLYYDRGECVMVKTFSAELDEIQEIVSRLGMVSEGTETSDLTLRRNSMGQLGFHVHYEGVISDVDPSGFAYREGLRASSRLVEICKVAVSTLTHEQMVDLLRTSLQVKVVVIAPHENGSPRRGRQDGWLGNSPRNNQYTAWMDGNEDSQRSQHLNNRMEHYTDAATPQRRPLPITGYPSYHSDFRSVTANLEPRFKQASNSHSKQPSHDSAASRSSGRGSEGHGSEDLDARHDGYPSDGFASGDERSRHHRDGHDAQWAGKVTIYPAYSRNSHQSSSPGAGPISPKSSQPLHSQWHDQTAALGHHTDYDHRDSANSRNFAETFMNTSHGSTAASFSSQSQSAFSPVTQTVSPQAYAPYHAQDRYATEDRGSRTSESAVPSSVTNLSHHSDTISSHSSGHSNGSSKVEYREELRARQEQEYRDELRARQELEYREELRARQEQEYKEELRARQEQEFRQDQKARQQQYAKDEKRRGEFSPSGRRRHTVVGQRARTILDSSPHSSNNSSPQPSRRNLAMVASDENLTSARLRPAAASPVSKSQQVGKTGGSSRNFQEDLMRLIDPDLSFTEGDLTRDRDEPQNSQKSRRRHGRMPRIHRTYSDESMCGRNTRGRSPRHIDSNDVIFTAAPSRVPPAKPPRNRSHDRISPRRDNHSSSTRSAQGQSPGSPILPLPDPAQGINWNNLVDAANRAFLGGDLGSKTGSLGTLGEPSGQDHREHHYHHQQQQHSTDQGLRNSLSGEHMVQHSSGKASKGTAAGHTQDTDRLADRLAVTSLAGRGAITSSAWQGSDAGSSGSLRLQDLEARLTQLERDFERERSAKEALQQEVERLQEDNARLQEESQTAAAQLRRFTEWFFNTIDKH